MHCSDTVITNPPRVPDGHQCGLGARAAPAAARGPRRCGARGSRFDSVVHVDHLIPVVGLVHVVGDARR